MFKSINIYLLFFLAFLIIENIIAKEIAISLDDVPLPGNNFLDGHSKTKKIINTFKINDCPSVGIFVVGSHINAYGFDRVRMYINASHTICNHSYNHYNLNKVNIDIYLNDIEKADRLISSMMKGKKLFRFPYLASGDTQKKRIKILNFLHKKGYSEGYVTIKTADYILNKFFLEALKEHKKINYKKLKFFYINHLWECINFYEKLNNRIFNKEIKHIILLHENDLAALFLSDFIKFIKNKGWKIISIDEAYRNPIIDSSLKLLYDYESYLKKKRKEKGYNSKLYPDYFFEAQLRKRFNESNIIIE